MIRSLVNPDGTISMVDAIDPDERFAPKWDVLADVLAIDCQAYPARAREIAKIREELELPLSDSYYRYDWRHHVPDPIRARWGELPMVARVVAYRIARDAAATDDPVYE